MQHQQQQKGVALNAMLEFRRAAAAEEVRRVSPGDMSGTKHSGGTTVKDAAPDELVRR